MKGQVIVQGNCLDLLRRMPDGCIHTCVTSPPYFGLRSYLPSDHPDKAQEIGTEKTPDEYVARLVEVFREVRRVLRDDGTLWLNLGDSYARTGGTDRSVSSTAKVGSTRNTMAQMSDRTSNAVGLGLKEKDLIGIPWRVAFALQADGWYLRQDIIWHKPNPMPESVRDRCTKSHEYIFLLSKSPKYYFDSEAIKEPSVYANCGRPSKAKGTFKEKGEPLPGQLPFRAITETRNKRSVWTVATKPFKEAHFAVFPPDLIEPCILAGCPESACAACGAPWERVVKRTPMEVRTSEKGQDKHDQGLRTSTSGTMTKAPTSETIGFRPTCTCEAGTSGGLVLDPFAGAGTTRMVAAKHGRRSVSIELSADYVEIAKRRASC